MSWRTKVRRTDPYTAGEQPKDPEIIKLNSNECPYPPAPGVEEAAEMMKSGYKNLRLYPDMNTSDLAQALADYYGVDYDQIFVGVGSDDVLALSFLTFFTNGGKLLFPDITYSFYDVWAKLFRIPFEQIPVNDSFEIDPADYIGRENVGGIIFPNPNAPTAIEAPQKDVEAIIAANPDCVVIVDEAYVDFGGKSAIPLLKKYDNLLVVQTFSKSRSMAGERIGFAIGNKEIIDYLKEIKFSFNSYTINTPSILLGCASVKDDAYFKEITGKIIATRERFKRELSALGFTYTDSKANFVFATHPDMEAEEIFKKLKERKIYVRYFKKPRIDKYLRITIGTDEQMDRLTAALHEILER